MGAGSFFFLSMMLLVVKTNHDGVLDMPVLCNLKVMLISVSIILEREMVKFINQTMMSKHYENNELINLRNGSNLEISSYHILYRFILC